MENKFQKEIDSIINDGNKKVVPRLYELAKNNDNDPYILYRIAVYKYEYGTPNAEDDFISLLNNKDYYYASNYYLGLINIRNKERNKAIKYLKNTTSKNNEYAIRAMRLLVQEYYVCGDYKTSINYFELLEKYEYNDENSYNYAAHSFKELKMYPSAINAIKNAIKLNTSEPKYINFIKRIPTGKEVNPLLLQLLYEIIPLNTPYTNELKLMVPELMYKTRYLKEALLLIRNYEENNLTSVNQTLLNFRINSRINNDAEAERLFYSVEDTSLIHDDYYKMLYKMYNKEALFEKSFDAIETVENYGSTAYKYILYYRAQTLMQMGSFESAIILLDEAIRNIVDSNDNEQNIAQFYRLRALCYYLNGDYDDAKDEIVTLNQNDGRKIELLLRKEFDLPIDKVDKEDSAYYQLLHYYDPTTVLNFIQGLFDSKKSMCGVTANTDLDQLIYNVNKIIKDLEPTYSTKLDSYLINLGRPIGLLDGIPTPYFIVDAMPGGKLYNIKPIIPTEDGKKKFRRVRY